MRDEFHLKGCIIPVPTPFDESGKVDLGAFLAHLDWLAECGVHNLLVNGTTGEFFSLTSDEQLQLLGAACEAWDDTLIFHTGSPSLFETLDRVRAAEDRGADFIASLPPFYFAAAPADGLVRWFTELAESASLPLLLYNFPRHTGNPLTADILRQIPHFGVKDSSANLSLIPATPNYFVGGDRNISRAYAAGARGVVSAAANIDPDPYLRIAEEPTPERQAAVDAVHARASGADAVGKIKKVLSELIPGYPVNLRLPLCGS